MTFDHYNRLSLVTRITTLVVILSISIAVVCLICGLAFGESQKECIKIDTKNLKEIGVYNSAVYGLNVDGCDWIVKELLTNGSGFHVSKWKMGPSGIGYSFQYFQLVKP